MSNELNVIELTDDTFDSEVFTSNLPVLVDFWAPWCGPCRTLGPNISEISNEYVGRVKVCKVNTDNNELISGRFNIRSLPTLLFFKNGKIINQVVGALPKDRIANCLDAMLQS